MQVNGEENIGPKLPNISMFQQKVVQTSRMNWGYLCRSCRCRSIRKSPFARSLACKRFWNLWIIHYSYPTSACSASAAPWLSSWSTLSLRACQTGGNGGRETMMARSTRATTAWTSATTASGWGLYFHNKSMKTLHLGSNSSLVWPWLKHSGKCLLIIKVYWIAFQFTLNIRSYLFNVTWRNLTEGSRRRRRHRESIRAIWWFGPARLWNMAQLLNKRAQVQVGGSHKVS